jgi:hypothetical protein
MARSAWLASCAVLAAVPAAVVSVAADDPRAVENIRKAAYPPVGGENSPKPAPPPKLVIETGVLSAGTFDLRVPTGTYAAPRGGAANCTVPGPIVAFKGPDGVWRGHGYLETYPRLLQFRGTIAKGAAELLYTFEKGRTYKVHLAVADGAVLIDETCNLGPRNLFVFDCAYGGWLPSSAFCLNLPGTNHAFLYLPCYYDRPEATINPASDRARPVVVAAGEEKKARPRRDEEIPAAVAVFSAESGKNDVAGFWCRQAGAWKNGDRMGIQLWQRRQLPGDPASRHFLGPETKSDSTPNPRTAGMLGKSLYEGHVTIELSLGDGTRRLGFAACGKGGTRRSIPEAFRKLVRAHR